jgi:hypothetical protein
VPVEEPESEEETDVDEAGEASAAGLTPYPAAAAIESGSAPAVPAATAPGAETSGISRDQGSHHHRRRRRRHH